MASQCHNAITLSLQGRVRNGYAQAICSIMILDNMIENMTMDNSWMCVKVRFSASFGAELIIRLLAEKTEFFTSREEAPWNAFDSALVLISVVDTVPVFASPDGEAPAVAPTNLSVAGTPRTVRFARILRLVRVTRFSYGLRPTVHSVIHPVVSRLRVLPLLLFIRNVFVIFLPNGVVEHFEGDPDKSSELSSDLILYSFRLVVYSVVSPLVSPLWVLMPLPSIVLMPLPFIKHVLVVLFLNGVVEHIKGDPGKGSEPSSDFTSNSFRLVVYSVVNSLVSLLWVLMLLLFIVHVFAIFFRNGVGEHNPRQRGLFMGVPGRGCYWKLCHT